MLLDFTWWWTGISQLALSIHNKKANEFLEWFEYSDKTIDGRSQKKAYELFDSPVYDQIEVGTTKGMYPWIGGSVLGLSVGYSPNQLTSRKLQLLFFFDFS